MDAENIQKSYRKQREAEEKETLRKELTDLRAERDELLKCKVLHLAACESITELKAERDKLKEDLREHGTTRNRLLSANSDIQRLKADNERLKEWKKEAEASLIEAGKNVSEMYDKAFTSELQRRWPSEKEWLPHWE